MDHYVTHINTLKENHVMQVEVMYRMLLLVYTEDKVYAIEDRCPHQGISLATGKIDGNTIKCKEHGLPISLKTGEVVSASQANFLKLNKESRSIATYPVVIKEDKVYITL